MRISKSWLHVVGHVLQLFDKDRVTGAQCLKKKKRKKRKKKGAILCVKQFPQPRGASRVPGCERGASVSTLSPPLKHSVLQPPARRAARTSMSR